MERDHLRHKSSENTFGAKEFLPSDVRNTFPEFQESVRLSREIGHILEKRTQMFGTAESCTGGNIAAIVTAVPGCSAYFRGGVVAYSNSVKVDLLHVSETTLVRQGAVSEETVREMVKGAIDALNADYAIATSGIAGPGGGTPEKPVGIVWIAAGCKGKIITFKQHTDYGRQQNIFLATNNALRLLYQLLLEG